MKGLTNSYKESSQAWCEFQFLEKYHEFKVAFDLTSFKIIFSPQQSISFKHTCTKNVA